MPQGKQASEFIKKPDIALKLIDKCLERGEQPGVVLIDAGYGNNSKFLQELESRKLRYRRISEKQKSISSTRTWTIASLFES